jgi:DNA-binding transcriptional LysR family regulator
LQRHDCIVSDETVDHAMWRLNGPTGVRELAVRGRLAVDSARAALQAAIGGIGIALLPWGVVADDLESGRLRQVLAGYGVAGGGLYVLFPSNRHVSAALRAFLDFMNPKVQAVLAQQKASPRRQGGERGK